MRLCFWINHKNFYAASLPIIFCAFTTCAIAAFPPGEPESTAFSRETAAAILQELRHIRRVLEKIERRDKAGAVGRPAVQQTAKIKINRKRPVIGDTDAPVTVVEFTDYQCPFCLRFMRNTFPRLKTDYINTGKVRWIILDMPQTFHSEARQAALAAHCAAEQGKFLEMRALLFENPRKLAYSYLPGYARELSLDVDAFKTCLDSDRYRAEIDQDIKDANAIKLGGTPGFIIGKTAVDEASGKVLVGVQPYSKFESVIREALGEEP